MIAPVNQLEHDKWVRVMCDFASHGIWQKNGTMASLKDIGDCDVCFDIGQWQNWFESRRHDDPIKGIDRFVAFGWRIVWDIKRVHPDWTVVYHDEKRGEDLIGMKLWLRRSE